jgi:four helix bundle protein
VRDWWERGVGEEWETLVGEAWRTTVRGLRGQRLRAHPYDCGITAAAHFLGGMSIINDDAFRAWEVTAPATLSKNPVWRFHAYRVALFLLDTASQDVVDLQRSQPRSALPDQLHRSVASISANIAEGLGRPTTADRARFMSMALGSLRESQSWYRAARIALPANTCDLRDEQLSELRRLLLGYQRWLAGRNERQRLI